MTTGTPAAGGPGAPTEGVDGTTVRYAERLWPRWWVWLLPPLLLGVLAVPYAIAYGAAFGWAIEIAGTLLAWLAFVSWSPEIGRAHV